MRERLRLRLKKKKEKTAEKRPPAPSLSKEDMVDRRGLEDLIKYINGGEEESQKSPRPGSKAAKRARQKQRKVNDGIIGGKII